MAGCLRGLFGVAEDGRAAGEGGLHGLELVGRGEQAELEVGLELEGGGYRGPLHRVQIFGAGNDPSCQRANATIKQVSARH